MGVLFLALGMIALSLTPIQKADDRALKVTVEAEETVYTYASADNGAGPMWCYGSTCIGRAGRDVFASGIETIPGAKPLNNVRWMLFRRSGGGWKLVQKDSSGRTREPCPLAVFPDGRLFLSTNPTLTVPDTYNGPARPEVLQFPSGSGLDTVALRPAWNGTPKFTEHSYRGICADRMMKELLVFNVQGYDGYHWSFLDRSGKWSASGFLPFPMGTEYEHPEPVRMCYPVMALHKRAAHALLVSDIIEPVKAWRDYKRQLTGREWDYEFRRLFYTWTPDLTKRAFCTPIEIASREKTAGQITNLDVWLDDAGRAHLLWLERSVWYPQMRDRFFAGTPLTTSLEYAVVDRGKVTHRATLVKGGEGASSEVPGYSRFHAAPGGHLYVLAYMTGADSGGKALSENRLIEITVDGRPGQSIRVPLSHPFTNFMTATERGGSAPSELLDILGDAAGSPGISYARVRIRRESPGS